MREWKTLALIAVLLLPTGCAQLFRVVGKPEITAVRPRITGLDFDGVDLAFDIDVHNPYIVPINSPKFRYGIDVEGAQLAGGETDAGVNLPAKSTSTVTLPVRLRYLSLWETYKKLADAREFTYTLRGVFAVSAMGRSFDLPLSHTGKLPVVRPPRFSNITVQFSGATSGGGQGGPAGPPVEGGQTWRAVTVTADIENPNVFDIGITSMGCVLSVAGADLAKVTASTEGKIRADGTGRASLTGQVTSDEASTAAALFRILWGGERVAPKLAPVGSIETPYGAVKFKP